MLSGWNSQKRVKIMPGGGLVPSPLSSIALPVHLGSSVGLSGHDLSALFSDLDPVDPHWSSVVLAMPMDGANGSTTFTDLKNHSFTRYGNTVISTAQSKFGGSSAYFDGNGDYIQTASSTDFDFGTGDFTIEGWVRLDNNTDNVYYRVVTRGGYQTGTGDWYLAINPSSKSVSFSCGASSTFKNVEATVTSSFSAGAWVHVAVVRSGTTVTIFVNGTAVASNATVSASLTNTRALCVGTNYNLGEYFKGYLQDLCIIKGVVRYTANFTPPTRSIATTSPTYSGLNPLAKKIALEIGDSGVEVPIGIVAADWDNIDHAAIAAKIYPTFANLDDGDVFYLYWDSDHADNASVTELGSAPSAPGSGDPLTVWNLAATDDLWDIASALFVVRALLSMPYALEGTLRMAVEQLFHLTSPFLSTCDQVYGIRLLAALVQRYGDVPQLRAILDQIYGSAAVLRRICRQDYGDALRLTAELDQRWSQYADLRALVEQKYSISGEELRRILSQDYDLRQYADLRAVLDQVYVVAPGTAIEQHPEVSVTTGGLTLSPHHISVEVDEGSYFIAGEIHLADEAEFLQLAHLQPVEVKIDATTFALLANLPRNSRPEIGRDDFVVPLASPSILLDAPYAEALTREFPGAMASAIAIEMAATAGIDIDWQLVDWYLPAATLYANGETPLTIIRKLVEAVGGVLQSAPDGTLICRPEYPQSLPERATAVPVAYLTDQDNFFSVDSSPEIRDGFNRYLVSDQGQSAADTGLTLEQRDIDEMTKEILIYRVPWTGQDITMRTSGGGWVRIVDEGVVEEDLTETVEIVAGEGLVAKPLYEKISQAYKQVSLGAITAAEDGHLATEISGNSLVEITYRTRYHLFTVASDRIEEVQFYPEEIGQ